MKIIYPERQDTIAADSEDPNFIVDNLLDDHPAKVWRAEAGTDTATLTLTVTKGEAVAIYGTNAVAITITVKNGQGQTVTTQDFTMSTNRLWMDYPTQTTAHTILIDLEAATGDTVEAGIVRAGEVLALSDPQYSLDEQRVDYSIRRELNSGAIYVRKRTVVRAYALSVLAGRDDLLQFANFYDAIGPQPFSCLLVEGVDDQQWTIFGYLRDPPQISHSHPVYAGMSCIIVESV